MGLYPPFGHQQCLSAITQSQRRVGLRRWREWLSGQGVEALSICGLGRRRFQIDGERTRGEELPVAV